MEMILTMKTKTIRNKKLKKFFPATPVLPTNLRILYMNGKGTNSKNLYKTESSI